MTWIFLNFYVSKPHIYHLIKCDLMYVNTSLSTHLNIISAMEFYNAKNFSWITWQGAIKACSGLLCAGRSDVGVECIFPSKQNLTNGTDHLSLWGNWLGLKLVWDSYLEVVFSPDPGGLSSYFYVYLVVTSQAFCIINLDFTSWCSLTNSRKRQTFVFYCTLGI